MADINLSDEELVEADRRAYRGRFVWTFAFALYGFVAAVAMAYGVRAGLIPVAWIAQNPPLVVIGIVVIAALPAMAVVIRRLKVPKAASAPRIQRKLVEDHQRRLRIANATCAIIVPLTAAMAIAIDIHHGGRVTLPGGLLLPCEFVFVTLIGLFGVLRGPSQGDERTRQLRTKATRAGFIVAVIGLGAVYLFAFFRPDLVRLAIPAAMALALASASLTFLIADWRASREN